VAFKSFIAIVVTVTLSFYTFCEAEYTVEHGNRTELLPQYMRLNLQRGTVYNISTHFTC